MARPFEYDVFLSFCSSDEGVAEQICQELGRGLRVYFSAVALKPGESWLKCIQTAVEQSKHMVLVASRASMKSPWVQGEYETFLESGGGNSHRRLIPLLVEGYERERLPGFLKRFQSVRFTEAGALRNITKLLGGTDIEEPKRSLAIREEGNQKLTEVAQGLSIEDLPGALLAAAGGSNRPLGAPPNNTSYTFNTTPQFDPCPSGQTYCTGFPASNQQSSGGMMAIAADVATPVTGVCPNPPCATLWALVPTAANPNLQGSLYAYTVTMNNAGSSFGTLTPLFSWDNGNPCSTSTAPASNVKNWFMPTFTEPTLADNQQGSSNTGAVYVPTTCVVTSGSPTTCYGAPSVTSGVLVFTSCPSGS